MIDLRTLSTRALQDLGDRLDHTSYQPSDLLVEVIEEQATRTAEQQIVAANAIASNRKRRALRLVLAKNVPAIVAPLDEAVLAQMRRDQAERKARKRRTA